MRSCRRPRGARRRGRPQTRRARPHRTRRAWPHRTRRRPRTRRREMPARPPTAPSRWAPRRSHQRSARPALAALGPRPPSLTPGRLQANGRAASPQTCKLHVGHLTRNVNEAHIREIFAAFGPLAGVELAMDKVRRARRRAARAPLAGAPCRGERGVGAQVVNLPRGFAYVEFQERPHAEKARLHMDGGQLDGNVLSCAPPPLCGSRCSWEPRRLSACLPDSRCGSTRAPPCAAGRPARTPGPDGAARAACNLCWCRASARRRRRRRRAGPPHRGARRTAGATRTACATSAAAATTAARCRCRRRAGARCRPRCAGARPRPCAAGALLAGCEPPLVRGALWQQ